MEPDQGATSPTNLRQEGPSLSLPSWSRRARLEGRNVVLEPSTMDADLLDTCYDFVTSMKRITAEDRRLVDPLFVVLQTSLSNIAAAYDRFIISELITLGRLHGVMIRGERKADAIRILQTHSCNPICQSMLYIFRERKNPRASRAWRRGANVARWAETSTAPSTGAPQTFRSTLTVDSDGTYPQSGTREEDRSKCYSSVWSVSEDGTPDNSPLPLDHPVGGADPSTYLRSNPDDRLMQSVCEMTDEGPTLDLSKDLLAPDISPRITKVEETFPTETLDHLEQPDDKILLSIVKEWQEKLKLSSFIRRPCACCSGLTGTADLRRVDSRILDLSVLRNDDIHPSLLPTTYNLEEYQFAILEPLGMICRDARGPLHLCKPCLSDIEKGSMPRLALSNWLYYAREHIPSQIRKDFEDMSVFEKALICRVRTNSLLCRFSLLQENPDESRGFSAQRRHIKGNIISTPLDIPRLNSILPPSPSDIADTMCALIVSHTPPTKATIDRLHPILVRKSRVKRLIAFLLANNPHYQRSQTFRGFSSEYLEALFEGSEDSGVPSSARIGHLPVNEAVEAMTDDYTGRLDGLDGIFMENVSYTLGDRSAKSYREMTLIALQHCKDGRPFLHSSAGSSPVPDIDNPNWLSWAHPNADPFGIGGFNEPRRRRHISMQAQIKHLLNVQDPYFEKDPVLTFDVFHIIRKGSVNTSLRFCVPLSSYGRIVEQISGIDRQVLSELREEFKANPTYEARNPEELKILRVLGSISPIAKKVPGSVAQRITMRNEIRGIIGKRGSPTLFITLNPADYYHPLVSVLALRPSSEEDLDAIRDLTSNERTQVALKHPVACAQFFNSMITGFVDIVLRCGRTNGKSRGAFGHCDAYYGTVETQGRGSLHCHMLVWLRGHLPPEVLASRLKESEEYRTRLCKWIDSIMDTGFLGSRFNLNQLTDFEREELRASEPHPGAQDGPSAHALKPKEFFKEAKEHIDDLLLRFNWHVHTGTCWKYLTPKDPHDAQSCRFGMDGVLTPETTVNLDDGSITIRRRHPKMTTYNPVTTFLLKCNSDVKFVGSGDDAKAFMYYVTDYITKAPLSMHAGLTALSYAIKQAETRGFITSTNNISDSRRAITIAVNSMLGHQEMSHPQVMHLLLGGKENYTNEVFQPFNWAEVHRYIARASSCDLEGPSSSGSMTQATGELSVSVSSDGADLSASSTLLDYIFRPRERPYDTMGLYTHISLSRKVCQPPPKETLGSAKAVSSPFSSDLHPQFLTHSVKLRKQAVTPVLLGPSISRRHGSDEERERWSKDMCILFKPWRTASQIKQHDESWTATFEKVLPLLSPEEFKTVENMSLLPDAKKARDDRPRRRTAEHTLISNDVMGLLHDLPGLNSLAEDSVFALVGSKDQERSVVSRLEALIGAEAKDAFVACHPTSSNQSFIAPVSDSDIPTGPLPSIVAKQASFMAGCKPIRRSKSSHKNATGDTLNEGDIEADAVNDTGAFFKPYDPIATIDIIRPGEDHGKRVPPNIWDSIARLAKDKGITDNVHQLRAFDIIAQHAVQGGKQLFLYIGGRGGTGKSYLIEAVVQLFSLLQRSDTIRLAAPTGIAASLIGGSTIHSLLQMSSNRKSQSTNKSLSSEWRSVDYLIIDEVSMIGAQLLAVISHSLKVAKADSPLESLKLFGGINVIFLGDFYQLSPPKQASLFTHRLVKSPSFMQTRNNDSLDAISGAYIWRQVEDVVILRDSKRHKDDPLLAELLDRMRTNTCQDATGRLIDFRGGNAIEHLRRRELSYVAKTNPTELQSFNDAPVIVGSKNLRDTLNACLLSAHANRLKEPITISLSIDSIHKAPVNGATSIYLWNLPSRQTSDYLGQLPLFKGMRVMITENISVPFKIVNGSEGTITDFKCSVDSEGFVHAEVVYVKIKGSPIKAPGLEEGVVPVFPVEASIKHHLIVSANHAKTFRRRQIPIVPAYSYTDYKSQGRTLDRAIIDITSARGQGVYVMLSRTKALSGLLILRWFPQIKILQRMSAELRDELGRLEELDAQTLSLYTRRTIAPHQALRTTTSMLSTTEFS